MGLKNELTDLLARIERNKIRLKDSIAAHDRAVVAKAQESVRRHEFSKAAFIAEQAKRDKKEGRL